MSERVQWEYQGFPIRSNDTLSAMNKIGRDGWEIIQIFGGVWGNYLYAKRAAPPSPLPTEGRP